MKILILDGHSRAAVETLQSLGRMDARVDVCSSYPNSIIYKSRYAINRFSQPDPALADNFVRWLNTLDTDRDYDLIVPSTEASLRAFLSLDDGEPLREKAVLPSNQSLSIALNKQRTLELGEKLGIPVPQTYIIEHSSDLPEILNFPVVLKTSESLTRRATGYVAYPPRVVYSHEACRNVLRSWGNDHPVLVQEFAYGHGYGIEMIYAKGQKGWHFGHERIHELPLGGGASTYRRSIQPPEKILYDAEVLLSRLKWHGVAMVEFKAEASGAYKLMEINPRLWGSLALSIDAGVNFPKGLYRLAQGKSLGLQPSYRVGYYTRQIGGDLDWMVENFRANHAREELLTRPRLMSMVEWARPLILKESWDHFDWRDLGVTAAVWRDLIKKYLLKVCGKLEECYYRRRIVKQHETLLKALHDDPSCVENVFFFLCFGNICRSPFASRYFARNYPNSIASDSAGFYEKSKRRTPQNVLQSALKLGLDLGDHRSQLVDEEMIEKADIILTMDEQNYRLLCKFFPGAERKTTNLGLFHPIGSIGIDDPYGKTPEDTDRVMEQIKQSIDSLATTLHLTQSSNTET